MRLQLPIYARKPVASLTLRVRSQDFPAGASVAVTDFQVQAGALATGIAPNPSELVPRTAGKQYRNGVVHDGLEVVALSNGDRAAPARVEVAGSGDMRVGSYRFGKVSGSAVVDGRAGTASQGWGRAPIITERSDLWLPCKLSGRAHVRVAWEELED